MYSRTTFGPWSSDLEGRSPEEMYFREREIYIQFSNFYPNFELFLEAYQADTLLDSESTRWKA